MRSREVVEGVIDALNELAIPYMLSGSFATNQYGVPRATQDADFVIEATEQSIEQLFARLPAGLKLDPQLAFETITVTQRYRAIDSTSAFSVEFFLLSHDAHDQERFRKRRKAVFFDRGVMLPTAEDIIIAKVRWYQRARRSKDREDVRNILAVQRDSLDWDYIQSWCERHETSETLESIRSSVSP